MDKKQLYLNPEEAKFLGIAVVSMLEDLNSTGDVHWNLPSQKVRKEMIRAGTALRIKLQKIGVDTSNLPKFLDGEEKDFIDA